MASIVIVSGSPSTHASAGVLVHHTRAALCRAGHEVEVLAVRDLPTVALLSGDTASMAVRGAVDLVSKADALVVVSPVQRAAYSGLVKSLLDLLPTGVLAGKAVLPLATGGSQGHIVAIEFALRPLLQSHGADRVLAGHFVSDRQIAGREEGSFVRPIAAAALNDVIARFSGSLDKPGWAALTG